MARVSGKNIIKNYPILLVVIICSFVINIAANCVVLAQSTESSKGMTLSPLRSEIEIAPGTSLNGELVVTNLTDASITVDLSAEEFDVINQQYDYSFTPDSNVNSWVRFSSDSIELIAGQSRQVKYSVAVPLSAEPGGRYISLFAGTGVDSSLSNNESRQRIASLLYITVLGDITRVGNIISLSSPWLLADNASWSAALQNTGTTHFRSRYNVQIINLLNNSVVASSQGEALILPGTIRAVSGMLPSPQLPGIYKISYSIGLGDTPLIVENRYVLFMPTPVIVVIIATITVFVYSLRRRLLTKH